MMHNHGPDEGPGLDCPEVFDAFDRRKGKCLPVTLVLPVRVGMYGRDDYAVQREPLDAYRAVAARRLDVSPSSADFELWRHRDGALLPHWSYGATEYPTRETGAGARAWLRGLRG